MTDMLREFAQASKLEVDWASIHAAPTETLVNALAMMCPFERRKSNRCWRRLTLKPARRF